MINEERKLIEKGRIIYCAVFGILFSLSCILGYQLQNNGATWTGFIGKLGICLLSLALAIPFFAALYFILFFFEKRKASPVNCDVKNKPVWFLCFWACIFVCWIPVFLAYYPCVMSSDFDIQIYQVSMGHEYYTNHHPYFSTLEIEFFYNLRGVLGTVRKAIAALGIWHLFAMSSAFAYSGLTVYRLLGKKWVSFAYIAIVILYPVNPVFSLCTTKDVIFSASLLYLICFLITRFSICNEQSLSKLHRALLDVGIAFAAFFMCSFRNNAMYAVVVAGIIGFFFLSKNRKKWLVVMLAVVVVSYYLTQLGIEKYLGVTGKTKTPEMHSVIIQTMGRAYVNNADTMSYEDKATIEYYIPKEALPNYNPALSDPLKTPVTNETFDSNWKNMGKVIADWLRLGVKYTDDYIDAVLDLTRGYWYIYDYSYATVWGADLDNQMGLLITKNTSGYYGFPEIWDESKLPKLKLMYEKILSRNDFFKWPVLNMFFRLAFYNWILLLTFGYSIYKKRRHTMLFLLLPIVYLCTLLLGPTAHLRYEYPMIICVAVLICNLLREGKMAKEI